MKKSLFSILTLFVSFVAYAQQQGIMVGDTDAKLITSASQISSPYTEPSEGSIQAMIDGNPNTFWHSTWTGGNVTPGTHYFEVEVSNLPEHFAITFTRRNINRHQITQWGIFGAPSSEASKNECTLLATWETPYTSDSETLVSPVYESQGFTRLRFYCESNTLSTPTSNGYFHLAEFQILGTTTICDPFTAPVSCDNGTVELTFKVVGLNPNMVEVSSSPANLSGTLSIPTSVHGVAVTGIGAEAFKEKAGLTAITLPEGLTTIGANAFEGTGLTEIHFPNTLTSIGQEAFKMSDLDVVSIPDAVTSIGASAFRECGNLQSVKLGSGITSIGSGAFYECPELTSVTAKMASPISITSNVFPNRANATLLVPISSMEAYAAANNWKNFKEFVGIISFADANVKSICIQNWDANGDGELTEAEAAAVTSLGSAAGSSVFQINNWITSFNELQYFTGLTAIANNAFQGCSGLTSVTIPSSVTSIGSRAFYKCSGLTSINIPSSVTSIGNGAFEDCIGLTSITIPSSVTSIDDWVFYNCSGLTSINIPNSVTSIGGYAFSGCTGLTSIDIPSSVTSIGGSAFYGCSGLTSIIVESGNTIYDSRDNCNAIIETSTNKLIAGCQNTVIPSSVASIGDYAFYGCSGLTSVTIPSSVTSIGDYAFDGCSGLTSINIPNSVTSIGGYAFRNCRGLTSIDIPNSVTSIVGRAFYNCSGLTSVTIPSSVTSIGDWAFYNCSGLTSIDIPNSVTSIGGYAFYGCSGLTSINIPNSVTSIGAGAFSGCSGLTSVTIPESVTSIGNSAFYGCSGLTSVTVNAETPIAITSTTFSNRTNATLYVPFPTKYLYETADYWKEFKEIVQMEGPVAIGDTFPAPVPNNDGTVDLTFKVTNVSPLEVEVSASPEDITGVLTIPSTVEYQGFEFAVKSIGAETFFRSHNLTAVTLPEGMTDVKDRAFNECENLESVVLPSTLTHIWQGAFMNCTSLAGITLPNGLTEISLASFQNTPSLKSINLHEGITTIEYDAFRSSGLESIKFPSTLTEVGHEAFRDCQSLTSIDFNRCSATFDYQAFGHTSVEELYIPNTVKFKNWNMFIGCQSLRRAVFEGFEDGQETWWATEVFRNCTALEEVVLPSTCVMGASFFANCINLQNVTFLELSDGFGIDTYSYYRMFDNIPFTQVFFTVPEGTANTFLRGGYVNLSDKTCLPQIREEFEAEATSITAMADAISDGDKSALTSAIIAARSIVNDADDYVTIYTQIASIKDAAKRFLTTATLTADLDVTAATIINPDVNHYPIMWNVMGGDWGRGLQERRFENGDVAIDNFLHGWHDRTLSTGELISQTITALPAGSYRLECDAIATWQDDASVEVTGVSLFAGNNKTTMATENKKPQHFSVTFENRMTRDVKIGIDINSTNANWVAMDNVRLYYMGEATPYNIPSHTELASSETDTLYLYNVEGEAFLKAGNSWGTHAVLRDEGLPVRLTQDSETGLWQVYFWKGSQNDKLLFREYGYKDEVYVDYSSSRDDADPDLTYWLITESDNGTYLIQNKKLEGTDKYMGNVPSRLDCQAGYTAETHTDIIATAASTENIHWLVMTKKQYEDYQRGLIYPNMLYVENTPSILPTGKATLELSLKKDDAVNMTDFYLLLPDGFSIAENASGKPDVTINSSRSNGHLISAQKNDDGYYHVICYSTKNAAFKDNEGLLFNIRLDCNDNVEAGSHSVVIKNILMSDVSRNRITQPDLTIDINVPDLQLGDVNDDGRIDGLDIVEMVDRIMQRPSDTFHFLAADLNFDNRINALDLVNQVTLVLNQGFISSGSFAPALNKTGKDNDGLLLQNTHDGLVALGTESTSGFILAQCIVQLPESMELKNVKTDESHTVAWQQIDDSRYAVVAYSTKNADFGTNEAMLTFDFAGKGDISVENVMLVDTGRQIHQLGMASLDTATGISGLEKTGDEASDKWYDLSGRRIVNGKTSRRQMANGVYIINGKKVVVK